MLLSTSFKDIFLLNVFNSLYLLKALVFGLAVIKNLNSASGIILYVISLPSSHEPLYFLEDCKHSKFENRELTFLLFYFWK